MVVFIKSSRAGKKRRGKFLANNERGDFYCIQGCVAEPLGRRDGDGGSLG